MKIQAHQSAKTEGSVLMTSLMTGFTIGLTLASYLIMVQQQNTSVFRSQAWNSGISITEAGIEDAMAQINSDSGLAGVLDSNGWTNASGGVYQISRTIGDGYYNVKIETVGSYPVITSEGFSSYTYAAGATPMFAVIGNTTSTPKYLTRKVKVNTKLDGLLDAAMAAKDRINLRGNNIASDSFDSSNPLYSTGGLYDVTKRKDGGDIVTDSVLTNSLDVGNANLRGTIRTGPKGFPSIGPNGSVGNSAWVGGGNKGIQPGHFADDMNLTFPDVVLPNVNFATPQVVNTNIGGVNYKYYLTSGNWQIDELNDSVYVDGDVTVYVPPSGRLAISGNQQIYIAQNAPFAPPTHSMKLYVGDPSASIAGNGVVNSTGIARNFIYYGLPSNTTLSYSGNSAFVGAIYCPNAIFTLGGGGNNTYDFVGASVSYRVRMNGHYNFHYDEDLRKQGPARGYVATKWTEL